MTYDTYIFFPVMDASTQKSTFSGAFIKKESANMKKTNKHDN